MKDLYPGYALGKATRDAYGEALLELGTRHDDIVVLDADLAKSTKSFAFGERFPARFLNQTLGFLTRLIRERRALAFCFAATLVDDARRFPIGLGKNALILSQEILCLPTCPLRLIEGATDRVFTLLQSRQ